MDEPLPTDWTAEPDASGNGKETADSSSAEQSADGQPHSEGFLPELDRLTGRMMQSELQRCSAEQLAQIHDRLGDMMKHVVGELHTRLCHTQERP